MDRQKILIVIVIFWLVSQNIYFIVLKEKESIIKIETNAEPTDSNINVDVLIVPPVEVDVAKSAKVVAGYFDVSE